MTATLIYNLPEEQTQFEIAYKSSDILSAIKEFDNWMINRMKHKDLSEQAYEELRCVQNRLIECLDDNEIKHLLDY